MVDRTDPLSVVRQCQLLAVPRSTVVGLTDVICGGAASVSLVYIGPMIRRREAADNKSSA